MKQIKSLLLLRSNQCYRYLNEIGFGIIIVAIFILTGVIFTALQKVLAIPAIVAPIFSLLILISIEIRRRDTFFLKSIFESKKGFIRFKFIESVLIISPILIFQGLFFKWHIVLLIISICSMNACFPFHLFNSQQKERKPDFNSIPLTLFEVKFYIEKKTWVFVLIWALLILGAIHISLWIIGMLFLCTLPVEIYSPIESREMINYRSFFVRKKILDSIIFFVLFVSLPTVVTLVFNHTNLVVLLYGIIAMFLSLILSVGKKYSSYYGVNEFVPSTTSTMILTFLMLAPGGILITLSACIYYYIRAEKHMKNIYVIL